MGYTLLNTATDMAALVRANKLLIKTITSVIMCPVELALCVQRYSGTCLEHESSTATAAMSVNSQYSAAVRIYQHADV